ncbi:putative metallopeptidase [Metallosphaera cuprina]|uniref:Metallopeptidase-like protein n=1 Tax=Metallosphaera cuprina (strain Ar-4) TaxID=1006006 RepID=F4G0V2_METCR|nr:putative metallopeptidase [Metallosphaera cuprina]AEB95911.1 metallopeptidase-like protein [Metallosphaera cuprina Ar-4]
MLFYSKLRFTIAEDVRKMAATLNTSLAMGIDLSKIEFIRSSGSRSRAYARTFSLPSQWRFVLNTEKFYIVEVISERFDNLTCYDKVYVVTHELMHIPRGMTGGLRNHSFKGFKRIRSMLSKTDVSDLC